MLNFLLSSSVWVHASSASISSADNALSILSLYKTPLLASLVCASTLVFSGNSLISARSSSISTVSSLPHFIAFCFRKRSNTRVKHFFLELERTRKSSFKIGMGVNGLVYVKLPLILYFPLH